MTMLKALNSLVLWISEFRASSVMIPEVNESWMQCKFDLQPDSTRHLLNGLKLPQVVHQANQHLLSIELFAKKLPIEPKAQGLSVFETHRRRAHPVEIAGIADGDLGYGLITTNDQRVCQRNEGEPEYELEGPLGQQVLETASNDDSDIEHTVLQDHVGEGNWNDYAEGVDDETESRNRQRTGNALKDAHCSPPPT